jgi:hypothetical protein
MPLLPNHEDDPSKLEDNSVSAKNKVMENQAHCLEATLDWAGLAGKTVRRPACEGWSEMKPAEMPLK